MPPLRERREDIRPLAAHFLNLSSRRLNCPDVRLTEDAVELLSAYDWPGNVRELQNVIERAVILSQSGPLRIDLVLGDTASTPGVALSHFQTNIQAGIVLSQQEMDRREHENILAALEKTRGRIYGSGGAAEILGMKPTTLAYRLKRMGIKRPDVSSAETAFALSSTRLLPFNCSELPLSELQSLFRLVRSRHPQTIPFP